MLAGDSLEAVHTEPVAGTVPVVDTAVVAGTVPVMRTARLLDIVAAVCTALVAGTARSADRQVCRWRERASGRSYYRSARRDCLVCRNCCRMSDWRQLVPRVSTGLHTLPAICAERATCGHFQMAGGTEVLNWLRDNGDGC